MDKESLANVSTLKARAAVGASEASAVLWWTVTTPVQGDGEKVREGKSAEMTNEWQPLLLRSTSSCLRALFPVHVPVDSEHY